MAKPMYCPMSFNRDAYYANRNKVYSPIECTPDCAWAVIHEKSDGAKEYGCAVADGLNCAAAQTRPIKGDSE